MIPRACIGSQAYEILERAAFELFLLNARYARTYLRLGKTDVSELPVALRSCIKWLFCRAEPFDQTAEIVNAAGLFGANGNGWSSNVGAQLSIDSQGIA